MTLNTDNAADRSYMQQQLGVAPSESEITQYDDLFRGTGRWGLMCLGANNASINTSGACNSNIYLSRRAGRPYYVMLKETARNKYIGYEIANSASVGGTKYLSAAGVYKPMARVHWEDAAWSYRNVADDGFTADALPQTVAAQKWFECDFSTKSTAVTRVGVVIGYTANNCGILIVELTDKTTGLPVACNLLPTAAQASALGIIAASDLVSGGGAIPDAAYVLSTNTTDNTRLDRQRSNETPVADNLPSGSYVLRCTMTTVPGTGGGVIDRAYVIYGLYGTEALSHLDAGAELYRMGYVFLRNDSSANEQSTWQARKNGTASAYRLMGGAHGDEVDVTSTFTLDDVATILSANTVSRSRTSGIATLVFDGPHGARPGDRVTISGLNGGAGSSYNQEGVTVLTVTQTTVPGDTLTYANTTYVGGAIADETTTADTAGVLFNHRIDFAAEVKMSNTSLMTHDVDGDLVSMTRTITGSGAKLAVRSVATMIEAIQFMSESYLWLATMFSASRQTYGPVVTGVKRFRKIDTSTSALLTAADNSNVLSDRDGLGYIAWDAEGGVAHAVVPSNPPLQNSGLFMQDRSPASAGIKKAYCRADALGTSVLPQGAVIHSGYDRYDAVRPGFANPLLEAA